MNIYDLALQIATNVHLGQRHGMEDYILHPTRVAERVMQKTGLKEDEVIPLAAILHDVLEDSELSKDDLIAKGIPKEVAEVVEILTKSKDESYLDYILRVNRDGRAAGVKVCDLEDNLSNLEKGTLRDKYLLAYYILTGRKPHEVSGI